MKNERTSTADFRTGAEDPSLATLKLALTAEAWPEFMFHDPVADRYWSEFEAMFPEWQIYLFMEGVLAGFANTVPFRWDRPGSALSDRGWDWMLERAVLDGRKKRTPNCLGGIQVCVKKEFQGRGLSAIIVRKVKETAVLRGLASLFIPVRPTLKCLYPLVPMKSYLKWRTPDGRPFDPWIRVHLANGGRVIKICGRSMTIPGATGDWEKWAGMRFPAKGRYTVKGALSPVSADPGRNRVVYVEENVWVGYRLTAG